MPTPTGAALMAALYVHGAVFLGADPVTGATTKPSMFLRTAAG